jgi:hypothetical protein
MSAGHTVPGEGDPPEIALSTCRIAAGRYREAAQCLRSAPARAMALLHEALRVDPEFDLARVALAVLDPASTTVPAVRPAKVTRAERHHVEIVSTALHGDGGRAAALLREHLLEVTDDPVAVLAVDRACGR